MRPLVAFVLFLGLVGCKPDADADGFAAGDDCDDANPAINPDAAEVCNGVDDDCDGAIDPDDATDALTFFVDADADSFGDPANTITGCAPPDGAVDNDDDCDDANAAVKPGVAETCNGTDDDCDGVTDPDTSADATTWFADDDDDGFGDGFITVQACAEPDGYVVDDSDCDDLDGTTFPAAAEVCGDGYENDCNFDGIFDCDAVECGGDPACVPTLTGITPDRGFASQATAVTVTGSGFASLTAGTPVVSFGPAGDCTSLVVVDDATITCDTPKGDAGTVNVTVTTDNGEDTLSLAYTFVDAPLYVADGKTATSGALYSVDVDTAVVTEIGKIGYAVTAMAFSPDGTLFALTAVQGSGSATLITIDTGTGAGTKVADVTGRTYPALPDATFVGSRFIAWSEQGDEPVEIDTVTGVATELGSSSIGSAGSGLAYDGSTLWFVPYGSGPLYKIDPSTGAGTSTGVTMSTLSGSTFNAMTFHNGTMYVNDAGRRDSTAILSSVSTSTGKITAVAKLSGSVDAIASPTP